MTMHNCILSHVSRRGVLAGAGLALLMSTAPLSAQDLSGELVILQWEGGVEAQIWADLESAFMERHPDVSVRELVVTGQGDMRGAMRTALLGGEVVDIIINTWPAFRAELADAGIIRPIDEEWEEYGWSAQLSPSWRDLGSYGGDTYGLTYTYGNRSGLWYKTEHLENAGIEPPATWEEFLASFETLQGAGYGIPVAIGAKYWAHAEWFETLLARTAGVEALTKLASREMAWTDPAVKGAFRKFAEMLEAGCCGSSAGMFANDWDSAADQIFLADASNFMLIGMWMNGRARNLYGLEEGVDYSMFQFPALGMGYDNTSIVDSKEVSISTNGRNPEAAAAFLDFLVSAEAADILGGYGYAAPTSEADAGLLGPVQQVATSAVAQSDVHFVLGDLLAPEVVDEYRVQIQRFLQEGKRKQTWQDFRNKGDGR
jgi:ABC-type glycerol-3-phosphate transport system substrate-binding protein